MEGRQIGRRKNNGLGSSDNDKKGGMASDIRKTDKGKTLLREMLEAGRDKTVLRSN